MSRPSDGHTLTLRTTDDVRISAWHLPSPGATSAIILLHGFSGTWRHARTIQIVRALRPYGAVIAVDQRGHGGSQGLSTVGDEEVRDVEAAVAFARTAGYTSVRLVGFSMGAAVAVRYAGLADGVDAVAAVSGPAHWYYRGTARMRWVHRAVELPAGRLVARGLLGTRVSPHGWAVRPLTPEEVAGKIAPARLLVMHGTHDPFFPLRHAYAIHAAAAAPKELWIEPGMGHAESAMTPQRVRRLGAWLAG